MPDTIMRDAPPRDAGLDQMWIAIGERYAEVVEADRVYGDRSRQAERASARWFAAERRIANTKGTSAALLLMKLELVASSGNISEDGDDFVGDAVRGMIEDLRAMLGDAAPVPYSTFMKQGGA